MQLDDQAPLLRMRKASFRYPDAAEQVLKDIDLEITPGFCYCLTGPTGSGKTTLARILSGLAPDGDGGGELEFAPAVAGAAMPVGLVLQDPDVQLLASTVGAEVAFGLENLGVTPAAMPERVSAALTAVGLAKAHDFPVDKLSMGQKYRVLIAAHLVMEARLLILDEPGAQLDPEGLLQLRGLLERLKAAGIAVLLCEHRPEPLLAVIDEFWQLPGDGRLQPGRWTGTAVPSGSWPVPSCVGLSEALLHVEDLAFQGADGQAVWSGVGLELRRGERLVVTGLNGTGKTTLLRCLLGFLAPSGGQVSILDGLPEPGRLRGRVGLLFQNPQSQLFENTVREEISFALKRLGLARSAIAERVSQVLQGFGIEDLAEASPHKLSYGQKHLVALAAVLAPGPELLLLDDPLAGLDGYRSQEVLEVLVRWSDHHNMALIWTSHEPDLVYPWAHRVLRLEGGRLVAA